MESKLNHDIKLNKNTRFNSRTVIKRNLLRHQIREAIQEAIESKQIEPGERISETQWAKDMGVSKAPVREAVRELEAMGFLENRPFQGSYVRTITTKDIQSAYQVRRSLEGFGVREAAKCINKEELEELQCLLNEMECSVNNDMLEQYIEKDHTFHERIIEITDNEFLLRLWKQSKLSEWKIVKKMSRKTLEEVIDRHKSIFNALLIHDEDQAELAINVYLDKLMEQMIKRSLRE